MANLNESLIEQLATAIQERDAWELAYNDKADELESLQRDKAELIEVLEWYASGDEIYDDQYELDEDSVEENWICRPSEISIDAGDRARTILSRMKGETP